MVSTTPSEAGSQSASVDPAAPTSITRGARATALTNIFNEALAHTRRTCSYDNFAACFPTPARYCANSLRALWAQMMERFELHAKVSLNARAGMTRPRRRMLTTTWTKQNEFDAILSERAVVPALNDLDRLIADAQRRKARASSPEEVPVPYVFTPAPHGPLLTAMNRPHTLSPPTHLQAHLAPYLSHQQSHLNARIQTTQSRNAALATTVAEQKNEIQGLLEALERVVADVEDAGKVLGQDEKAVKKEMIEIEGTLRASS